MKRMKKAMKESSYRTSTRCPAGEKFVEREGLLTYPGMSCLLTCMAGNGFRRHTFSRGLTAAGTVTDSHRVPMDDKSSVTLSGCKITNKYLSAKRNHMFCQNSKTPQKASYSQACFLRRE